MATSTISNTIKDASGTAVANVTVVARLKPGPAFRTSDSSEIAGQVTTTTNGSGAWTLTLEQQANIMPANSWWEIEEQIPDTQGGRRTWAIQVGAINATLQASLIAQPPAASPIGYLTQTTGDARYTPVDISTLYDANGQKLFQIDPANPADHAAFWEFHGGNDPSGTLAEYSLAVNNSLATQTKMLLGVRGDCTTRTQEVTEAGSLISLAGHVEGALNVVLELAPLATGGLPGINFYRMTSNVTGQAPILSAVGPDTNVSMVLAVQNNGTFHFARNLSLDANDDAFAIETVASGVNHVVVAQTAIGSGPNIRPDGPDTDIDLNFNVKGTGRFYFAGATVQCGGDTGGQGGTTGITNAIGVGNGANANLQAPAKGTGSGPASPVVAQWLKVYVGAAAGWVPWCQ